MKVVRVIFGAVALSTVIVNAGTVEAQGLPQLSKRVDALENALGDLGSRADSFESTADSLDSRVGAVEDRLEALEGAFDGLACPEGQFVRGFNTSGDLLCAAPTPQENPDEIIALPELGTDLRERLNELLVTNVSFSVGDVSGEFGLGSFDLTDMTLQLTCTGACVPTLEARTPGDGSTLSADYDFDGRVEVDGSAKIVSPLVSTPFAVTFILTYEDVGVGFSAEIAEVDGGVVSVVSNVSPDTTDLEIFGAGAFGDFFNLVANVFQSQLSSEVNAFFNDVNAIALGDLEPVDLPRAGT